MAIRLEPGELTLHLHYGKDLKDADWIGQQDPYVILRCGKQKYRSNTHECGGRNPVWDQQFVFNVDQETRIEVEAYDHDVLKVDDCLGKGHIDIMAVRHAPNGKLHVQVPLFRRLSKRQQGHLHVTLMFRATAASAAAAAAARVSGSGASSTLVAHEREAAVRAAAAAAVAAENAAAALGGAAPRAHAPAAGSSLPAGLVTAGNVPDVVPIYEPTTGLIEPLPHQRLPCHQPIHAGSAPASVQGAAAVVPSAPPPPPPGPAPYAAAPVGIAAAAAPNPMYPAVVHTQAYDISSSFAAPSGAGGPSPFAPAASSAAPPSYGAPYPHAYSQNAYGAPHGAPYPPGAYPQPAGPVFYTSTAPPPQPAPSFLGVPHAASFAAPPPSQPSLSPSYAAYGAPTAPPGAYYQPPGSAHV